MLWTGASWLVIPCWVLWTSQSAESRALRATWIGTGSVALVVAISAVTDYRMTSKAGSRG
jgi:hypothetical protein